MKDIFTFKIQVSKYMNCKKAKTVDIIKHSGFAIKNRVTKQAKNITR